MSLSLEVLCFTWPFGKGKFAISFSLFILERVFCVRHSTPIEKAIATDGDDYLRRSERLFIFTFETEI